MPFKDPEARKAYVAKWYRKNHRKILTRVYAQRKADPEKTKQISRRCHQRNRARFIAEHRELYKQRKHVWAVAQKRWAKNNREKRIAARRRWEERNREKILVIQRCRASMRRALARGCSIGERKAIREYYKWIRSAPVIHCFYCGKKVPRHLRQVDHFIPISRGGPHAVHNFRPSCRRCNSEKFNKMPDAYGVKANRLEKAVSL